MSTLLEAIEVRMTCSTRPSSKDNSRYQLSKANNPQNKFITLLSLILQKLM